MERTQEYQSLIGNPNAVHVEVSAFVLAAAEIVCSICKA